MGERRRREREMIGVFIPRHLANRLPPQTREREKEK